MPSAASAGRISGSTDRKSTRLNSSHTEIYTLSLHDALPICLIALRQAQCPEVIVPDKREHEDAERSERGPNQRQHRSEEHTSELQSHRDLHSFPTRRSSDLPHRLASGTVPRSNRSRQT